MRLVYRALVRKLSLVPSNWFIVSINSYPHLILIIGVIFSGLLENSGQCRRRGRSNTARCISVSIRPLWRGVKPMFSRCALIRSLVLSFSRCAHLSTTTDSFLRFQPSFPLFLFKRLIKHSFLANFEFCSQFVLPKRCLICDVSSSKAS